MFNILLHTRSQNMPIGFAKRTNNETKTKTEETLTYKLKWEHLGPTIYVTKMGYLQSVHKTIF